MRVAKYFLFISKVLLVQNQADRFCRGALGLYNHPGGDFCKESGELGLLSVKEFTFPLLG